MNFYFNYFSSIGREQGICHLSSVIFLQSENKKCCKNLTLLNFVGAQFRICKHILNILS